MLANLRYIHTDTYAVCVCVCAVCTASCLGVSLCFAIRLAKFAIKRNSMSLAYNWQSPSQQKTTERGREEEREDDRRRKDTKIHFGWQNECSSTLLRCSRGKSFA